MGTGARRLAALTGVVFVALLLVAFALMSGSPSTSASATKVQDYYLAHKTHYGNGGWLIALSVVFGVFFFGYLRSYFRDLGAEWLAAIFFGGAIIFATDGAVGAGVSFAISDHPSALSAQSLQLLNTLSSDLTWPFLSIGLAVVFLSAGFIVYQTRALPIWLAWVSWVFGVLAATEFLAFVAFIALAPWILYVAITLAVRAGRGAATVPTPMATAPA